MAATLTLLSGDADADDGDDVDNDQYFLLLLGDGSDWKKVQELVTLGWYDIYIYIYIL